MHTVTPTTKLQRGGPPPHALLITLTCLAVAIIPPAFAHRPVKTTIEGKLFLTETELRHEITTAHFLLPPAQGVPLLPDDATLEELPPEIQRYMATEHPVTIDGIRVPPAIRDLELNPVPVALYINALTNYVQVAFTAAYAINMPPRQISLVWQIYPDEPEGGWEGLVDADQDPYQIIQTFDVRGVGDFVYFHPDEPEFVWHDLTAQVRDPAQTTEVSRSTLPVPVASLLVCVLGVLFLIRLSRSKRSRLVRILVAAEFLILAFLVSSIARVEAPHPLHHVALPSDTKALSIFRSLHANVYRAFEYTQEEDIYDVLAQSVDGPLLTDLYAQIYKSLVLRFSGGAVCKVAKVEILETALAEKSRGGAGREHVLTVDCRWRVHGIVEHWEHLHRRVNEYQARFEISPRAGKWKICGVDITRQERVEAEDEGKRAEKLKD